MLSKAKAADVRDIEIKVLKNRFGPVGISMQFEYEPKYDTFMASTLDRYKDAFDECEEEFAMIADRKRERAERRKTRVKSQKQVETVSVEQNESYGGTVQQNNPNNAQGAYGFIQR